MVSLTWVFGWGKKHAAAVPYVGNQVGAIVYRADLGAV
jgi:hypothetical protein